ncbi:MAG: DNA repair protein RecN [Albidovulum sp.]|nr:DNA repair protein RecN [Albidovulum sp.]
MLRGLSISNVLLFRGLNVEFEPGLNVFTGETGAGKSILLGALGFVLGRGGRTDLVSFDAKSGEVSASFELSARHPTRNILAEGGFPVERELVLRRVVSSSGRRTAFINERRCSSAALREIGASLIEIHGQNDELGLLNPLNHREFLDDFAKISPLRATAAAAWKDMKSVREELDSANSVLEEAESEIEFLEFAVSNLNRLDPKPGEEEELDSRRRLMKNSARILGDLSKAAESIGESGAENMVGQALRWLEGASTASDGRLGNAVEALERAFSELGQAQQALEEFRSSLEFDPFEIDAVEERLFEIRAAARKHRVAADELPELAKCLESDLERLKGKGSEIDALKRQAWAADAKFDAAALELTSARRCAAAALDNAMSQELVPVKLEKTQFKTEVVEGVPGPEGRDKVQFYASTNPGTPPGPINRIASGGELSRFVLALKVCLYSGGSEASMVFDEIDRGVGGATADAVGRRLKSLADNSQVLVVTHSPQVAAFGSSHWRVAKETGESDTKTNVISLSESERVSEIARMLAGDRITDEAVAAAQALLDRARE